jgi:hypothetical protein
MNFERPTAVRKNGVNRIDGDPECHVIYFLPWQTPYAVAKACGLLPLAFAACYEMPRNVVSGDPLCSLARLEEIVDDAQERISRFAHAPLIIGFSIGTVPATCLANRHSAPLLSICSAPRGADIIWQSPLARPIKHHAIALGFTRGQFRTAFRRIDPANNLARLPEGSAFVAGAGDKVIPHEQTAEWLRLVATSVPDPSISVTSLGHVATIMASRRLQVEMYRRHVLSRQPT